jgi:hypothetical protein
MTNTAQEFKVGDKVKYKKGEDFSCNVHQPDKEYTISEVIVCGEGNLHTLIKFKGEMNGCYSHRLEHCAPQTEKHIHHDLIVAWAKDHKGVIIQFKNKSDGGWMNTGDNNPSWSADVQYRIKPKTKEVQRWKWVFKVQDGYEVTNAYYTEEEANKHFGKALLKIEDSVVTAIEEI